MPEVVTLTARKGMPKAGLVTGVKSNGEEDGNMPLKDSTETKIWAVKNVEEVGWAVGQI
ncbi:hypothetical protein KSP40_PGU000222 [Platanthera guangdongensis]|uniref:Uncharacterized protein n=1 Tax=Platanthera guangdongensis TaxID=2320717 RepID=A0ABR2MIN9_9ASPA